MEYKALYEMGVKQLKEAGIEEASLDARLLLEETCGTGRNDLLAHGDRQVAQELSDRYMSRIEERKRHIPLQHILGYQEFMGIRFKVTPGVLIPRQDTETLVEEALKICQPGMRLLDLGTGSGCIVISLMKNAHGMTAIGSDISKQALLVAKENGKLHEVDIDWIRSNLYENITGRFDLIVSNPPYIAQADILELMPEVRDFEPVGALDGGVDGLEFYRQIVAQSKDYLNKDGYLYLEIGYDQGPAVTNMMCAAGYREVSVIKDLAHHERVVKGRI